MLGFLVATGIAALLFISWLVAFFVVPKNGRCTTKDAPLEGDPSVTNIKLYSFASAPGTGAKVAHSFSPGCEKAFTFLTLSGLDFKVIPGGLEKAPKGKLPFIMHGTTAVADSTHIVRYIVNTFAKGQKSLGKMRLELTPREQAIGIALQRLCDDSMYSLIVIQRWVRPQGWVNTLQTYGESLPAIVTNIFFPMSRKSLYTWLMGQGILRHSDADLMTFGMENIDTIAEFLGEGPFLFGKDITIHDCSLFSFLDCLVNNMDDMGGLRTYARSKANLVTYVDRFHGLLAQS